MLRIGCAFPLVFVATGALASCYEPTAPFCATAFGQFEDEDEFDNCRRELERYKSDANDFIECNNRIAQDAIDKAKSDNEQLISDYDSAVDAFNRRVRGY